MNLHFLKYIIFLYGLNKKFIFLNFLIYIIIKLFFWKPIEIKVCVCTIGKLENLYVREYVSHYINYGVDKIFIYDNNDINGERFESVINDYIEKGFVEIINFRSISNPQLKAYQECLNNNYNNYNWLIFYDMDEFIFLKDFRSIKKYLSQQRFNKCETIQLNMFFHNDNNLLYYENKSLYQRFTKKVERKTETLKSIVKGNITININCVHNINNNLKSCNGFGQFNEKEKALIFTQKPDYIFYYIDHFCFKSTEEFINKLNKGDAFFGENFDAKMRKIGWYFDINEIKKKKIVFIENHTKLNLSKYFFYHKKFV